MPTDVQRIQAVFLAAAEIADPAARSSYLDGVCGADAGLRARVEALLRAHDQPDSLLDHPVAVAPGPDPDATEALTRNPDPVVSATRTVGGENGASEDEPLTFLSPSTRPDSLGRIGHYEVLQILGRGGFGIVFRAFDETLQRVVALKVMAPQLAATSPARKRFLREARSSAQVRHENVVQVYEVAEQPLPYLAMEFIPGETLQQRLDRVGPVEPAEVVRVGRQIAGGLAAAHAMDLIHRDIKPGNVLLESGQQRVKITDFGLARTADDASISQSGIIAGTPMYMAPEQAKGETLDQRADLFSLGSVLYQMAAGRPPFRANGTVAVLRRVAEDTPRPIREIIPETPQWLCDIIAKLHAKDPADRYQSAREVADLLADCEAQLKAHARLKDYSRIPRGKPRRSGRWKWVAVAATVLLFPVIALTVTEFAGVTHLFRVRHTTTDPIAGGGERHAETTGWHGWPVDAPEPAAAPFDAAQARAHQEAWAGYLGVPVDYTNSIGMKFVLVPPGEFMMGSTPTEIEAAVKAFNEWPSRQDEIRSEAPRHRVILTRPFYFGVYEVTQAEYEQVERRNPSYFAATGEGKEAVANMDTKRHPVELVSWNDAADFCSELSRREQYRPFDFQSGELGPLLAGTGYRLPSEAEWEFACRAGTTTRYWIGDADDDLARAGWFDRNDGGRTHAVGELKANPFGLYDVHGNVWEWVLDGWDSAAYAPFRERPAIDPCTPFAGAVRRVFRGGLWGNGAVECRAASRNSLEPSARHKAVGFRVVLPVARTPSDIPSARTPTPPTAPFTDADVQRIAALPAEQQVEEVRKELMKRNPGFGGKMETKIEDGAVTELKIVTDHVTDIAPIRIFNALRALECSGTNDNGKPNGLLADLAPLTGMNLTGLTHLNLDHTKVADGGLTIFKGCKNLLETRLWNTKVSDAGLVNFKDCKNLTILDLGSTRVTDAGLANFQGCKDLTVLYLHWTNVGDEGLVHFRDCNDLAELTLAGTKVSDAGLAHFKDCKNLTSLHFDHTQIGDAGLAPFKGMPLRSLWFDETGITDLTPLQGMPLEDIRLTPKNIVEGLEILRDMKSLKTIGTDWIHAWSAAEFWQRYDKGEFGAAPFTDADAQRIAALPAEQQVEEVRKELMRRNPAFDGKLARTIENGVVTGLTFLTDEVDDISPVRALKGLTALDCSGAYPKKGKLSDLSPLKGMSLKQLNCRDTQVAELTALRGMPLTIFSCANTQVSDLTPLKDMALVELHCTSTGVRDLSPLRGMKLRELQAQAIPASDLTPLQGMPLTHLDLYNTVGVTSVQALQGMPLEYLNLAQLPVSDLSPLKGMTSLRRLVLHDMDKLSDLAPLKGLPLTELSLRGSSTVGDLEPLRGMPLTKLLIFNTAATDLKPLQGMALEEIRLTPRTITKGLDILRDMRSLKTIGISWESDKAWPAAEFWERYDRGEFK